MENSGHQKEFKQVMDIIELSEYLGIGKSKIYALIRQNDRAQDDFDFLVKAYPDNVVVLNNRGNFFTGRQKETIYSFTEKYDLEAFQP